VLGDPGGGKHLHHGLSAACAGGGQLLQGACEHVPRTHQGGWCVKMDVLQYSLFKMGLN